MRKIEIIRIGELCGYYDENGNFVVLEDCGLTDYDIDKYAVQVQNGEGYYDSKGHFKYYDYNKDVY